MSIWRQLFGSIAGGWKTYGPNAIAGPGAFDSDATSLYDSISPESAMRLSAVYACMSLRAETMGSLPLHLRNEKKEIVKDHPLYTVLHDSPNSMQTAPEFWSMCNAHVDMYGNAISVVERRRDKSVVSLEPVDPRFVTLSQLKSGAYEYKIGDTDKYPPESILHLRGFSMQQNWGLPRIEIGRLILAGQVAANESAQRAFRQSLKVGGFFSVEQNLDTSQLLEFQQRLNTYGLPENTGKFMTLLKGMKPIGGAEFRMKPAEAELLMSRYFGIEEICRLFNTPPQLIGHSDKASSWASSLEQVNLFFLMYSLQPSIIRTEARIAKTLLTPDDRAQGIVPKFSIQGLLRADLATRQAFYASALQNGYYNRDEVRDLEDRGTIDGGDVYTVQLNMTDISKPAPTPAPPPVPLPGKP